MVQWLRLCALSAGGPGLIPGQGARSHVLQLRVHMLQLKDPTCGNEDCVATKTQLSQINKQIFLKNHSVN